MKVLILVLWFLLGASYFLLLGMAQERCCNSGISPDDDLIGQEAPLFDDQVRQDSLINYKFSGRSDQLWRTGAIW